MKRTRAAFFITPLHILELTNALELRVFRKELLAEEIKAAQGMFRSDMENGVFAMAPLPEQVFERARRMSQKYSARLGTRAIDVLHVASAQAFKADLFCTFDTGQRALARALRLRISPL